MLASQDTREQITSFPVTVADVVLVRSQFHDMKIYTAFIFIGLLAVLSTKAQNAPLPGQDAPAPLAPGNYVIVSDPGLAQLRVTFVKKADGTLTFACPDAPSSPPAVLQAGEVFQFSICYPNPEATGIRCLLFVGHGRMLKGGRDPIYDGSFAQVQAYSVSRGNSAVLPGTFVLVKIGDKP
jgi:hypothetical protein